MAKTKLPSLFDRIKRSGSTVTTHTVSVDSDGVKEIIAQWFRDHGDTSVTADDVRFDDLFDGSRADATISYKETK